MAKEKPIAKYKHEMTGIEIEIFFNESSESFTANYGGKESKSGSLGALKKTLAKRIAEESSTVWVPVIHITLADGEDHSWEGDQEDAGVPTSVELRTEFPSIERIQIAEQSGGWLQKGFEGTSGYGTRLEKLFYDANRAKLMKPAPCVVAKEDEYDDTEIFLPYDEELWAVLSAIPDNLEAAIKQFTRALADEGRLGLVQKFNVGLDAVADVLRRVLPPEPPKAEPADTVMGAGPIDAEDLEDEQDAPTGMAVSKHEAGNAGVFKAPDTQLRICRKCRAREEKRKEPKKHAKGCPNRRGATSPQQLQEGIAKLAEPAEDPSFVEMASK